MNLLNLFLNFFYKTLIYIGYKKNDYIFGRSKKFIASWGEKTYGQPEVLCFDLVSKLFVGKYTSIASNVSILLGSNHKRGLVTNYPRSLINKKVSAQETNEKGDVVIGNDVWIGYGVTIVGPVTIGDGAIIGASALVVNDVPSYAVVGGVPSRVIKHRFNDSTVNDLLAIKWWDFEEDTIKKIEKDLYSNDIESFVKKYKKIIRL